MATHLRDILTERSAALDRRPKRQGAFTLLELLVVVGIIVVLISILLPSLRKSIRRAASTVCMHNLKQIGQAIDVYRVDNNGWGPTSYAGESTDDTAADSVWMGKLTAQGYVDDPAVFICPDDPLRPWMLRNSPSGVSDLRGTASSYGMNELVTASPDQFLCNLERYRPKRPLETILIADVGPDGTMIGQAALVAGATRSMGRLPLDDGYSVGSPEPPLPWLTARHLGGMNVLMHGWGVQWVSTRDMMSQAIEAYYPACAAGNCALCTQLSVPHYSFAASQAFWWTGPVPTP